jgi:flagellar motor switch/type III secretory pathway protein FliN
MNDAQRLSSLDDVPVEVEALVPGLTMRVSEVLALQPGSVVATARPSGESLDVFAGGSRIGTGEFSTTGGRTVIRMIRLGSKA